MAIDEYAAIFKRCGTQLRFLSSSEYRLEFVAGTIQAPALAKFLTARLPVICCFIPKV